MPSFRFDDVTEPQPPRWGRRVLVAVVVLTLLTGVGFGIATWVTRAPGAPERSSPVASQSSAAGGSSLATGPSTSSSRPATSLVSGVLFANRVPTPQPYDGPLFEGGPTNTYAVGVASVSGAGSRPLTSVTISQGLPMFAAVSPGRARVLFPNYTELDVKTGRVSSPPGLGGMIPIQPWVASTAVLMLTVDPGGTLPNPYVVTHGSGSGAGPSASTFAGDPNVMAVFAVGTQIGDSAPSLQWQAQLPTGPPTGTVRRLATAATLARMVGLPAKASVKLGTPVVSPDGTKVAVSVTTTAKGATTTGWAVVTSTGKAVSAVAAEPGRPGWAVWSSGSQLALSDVPQPGTARRLRLASPPRSGARMLALPRETPDGVLAQPCLFSPDGGTLLCGNATRWVRVAVASGSARVLRGAPGVPLAWVSGSGG